MRLILLLMLPIVAAALIDVSVSDFINCDVIGFKNESFGDALKINFEAYNSGSIGCLARFRLDVYKEKYSFTAWSKEVTLQPNDRENIEFYWFPFNNTGNFTAKILYYCANEIKEIKEFDIEKKNYLEKQPTIEIVSPRFFEDKIAFKIKTNTTGDFAIIPLDYPKGWIVEQKTVFLKANRPRYVELDYKKDLWKVGNIKIAIIGAGEYGIADMEIKKESFINEILFKLSNIVNNLFLA